MATTHESEKITTYYWLLFLVDFSSLKIYINNFNSDLLLFIMIKTHDLPASILKEY